MNLVAEAEIWCSVGLSQGWHGGAALRVGCYFQEGFCKIFFWEAERCCFNLTIRIYRSYPLIDIYHVCPNQGPSSCSMFGTGRNRHYGPRPWSMQWYVALKNTEVFCVPRLRMKDERVSLVQCWISIVWGCSVQFLLNILSFISIEWDGILVNCTDYELGGGSSFRFWG